MILDALELKPPIHPLRTRFCGTIVWPACLVKQALKNKKCLKGSHEPDSPYWQTVWDAVSDETPLKNNLRNFDFWIRVCVVAGGLQRTKALGQKVQQLETEEGEVAGADSQELTWEGYIRGWAKRLFPYLTRGAAWM